MSVPRSADIVVAGIGTAGAVLASRLAGASRSAVAREAGPDPGQADAGRLIVADGPAASQGGARHLGNPRFPAEYEPAGPDGGADRT